MDIGWGLRIHVPLKFPADANADADVPETALGDSLPHHFEMFRFILRGEGKAFKRVD